MKTTTFVIISFTFIVQGYASHYSPGLMEEVIGNRIVPGRTWADLTLPLTTRGYIAVPDCDDIGDIWWLRPEGREEWERFTAVDCPNPIDGSEGWMKKNRILAEVDYPTAVRWNTVGQWLPIERRLYGYIWTRLESWEVPNYVNSLNHRRYR